MNKALNCQKIAFTGSHGTGKTTSVADLFYNFKIKHPSKNIVIFCENARNSPFKINTEGDFLGQLWIFTNQMSNELELSLLYDILIADRSIVDNIAYSKYLGYEEETKNLLEVAIDFIDTYQEIRFKLIEHNDYLFSDGIRDHKNLQYRQDIETIMLELYDEIFKKKPYIKERFKLI